MSCGTSCCKYLMFSFNLVFALGSLALLLLAVLAQVHTAPYIENSVNPTNEEVLVTVPTLFWILIGVATFAFLLSFIGCHGTIRESKCLLFFYATVLVFIIAAELIVIGVGYTNQEEILDEFKKKANSSLPAYLNNPPARVFWDRLQMDLECCGSLGPEDWRSVYSNNTLPDTCCTQNEVGKPCSIDDQYHLTEGCLHTAIEWLGSKIDIIFLVAVFIGLIEVLGIIIACCLGCSITDQYRTV